MLVILRRDLCGQASLFDLWLFTTLSLLPYSPFSYLVLEFPQN